MKFLFRVFVKFLPAGLVRVEQNAVDTAILLGKYIPITIDICVHHRAHKIPIHLIALALQKRIREKGLLLIAKLFSENVKHLHGQFHFQNVPLLLFVHIRRSKALRIVVDSARDIVPHIIVRFTENCSRRQNRREVMQGFQIIVHANILHLIRQKGFLVDKSQHFLPIQLRKQRYLLQFLRQFWDRRFGFLAWRSLVFNIGRRRYCPALLDS